MKNQIKLLIIIAFASILFSCEPEDKIINNTTSTNSFLMAYSNPNVLSLVSYPDKITKYADIYNQFVGTSLKGEITRMVSFYNYYFIFRSNDYQIDVLTLDNFKLVTTIDFSAEKKKPLSICFPNVTDAYIIFDKDSSVLLYDIVNFKPARTIIAGKYPTSIAAFGNQIYLTNQLDNTVSVIDSRTHKVEQTINVHEAPTFVDITADGTKALVISLGGGKLDSTKTKTVALASFIDLNTRLIVKTKEIGAGSALAVNQRPQAITITSKNYAAIATKDYLFRLETKFGDNIAIVSKGSFSSVGYSFKTDEVVSIKTDAKGKYLIISNPSSIAQKSSFLIDNNITSILPF